MKLRKVIKQNGKSCLYNNWGKAIAIVLLLLSVNLLFSMVELVISLVFQIPQMTTAAGGSLTLPNTSLLSLTLTMIMAIGYFLVMAPLNLGVTEWYYNLTEGQSPDILTLFNCFSSRRYFQSLSLEIHILGRKIVLALLYFALPAAVYAASFACLFYGPAYMNEEMSRVIGAMGMLFAALLSLLFAILYGIHIQKFFLSKYYLVIENLGVWEALKKSKHASRGKRGDIFLFHLSFLPGFLSCLLLLPSLYVQPYYSASATIYARFLMEQHYRSTQLVPVEKEEEQEETADSSADTERTQVFDCPSAENEIKSEN